MNVEPQKWFVGLMDFFSILLPGAVLTYLMRDRIGSMVLGDPYSALTGVEAWAVFLVSSYLAGHAVFLVGSWLDHPYDWLRGYTINTQIALLAREGRLLPWPLRTLVAVVFKEERNLAVDSAVRIKRHVLEPLGAQSAVNAFQWCKSTLTLASPESLATVQRFEADSKFFRCLVIVLLVLEIVWMSEGNWRLAVMGVVLIILALWRYMDQRFKSTNQAYWAVIALTGRDAKFALRKIETSPGGPTHAGGVVFRKRGDRTEYLLVEAKEHPGEWVLPKGHIEVGELPSQTAVREVREETGVWARNRGPLKCITYDVEGTSTTVQFFLMEAAAQGRSVDRWRRHAWLTSEEAIKQARHPESRELLRLAEQQRSATPPATS